MNVVASSTPATGSRYGRALANDPASLRRAGEHSTRHTLLSLYTDMPSGNISIEEFEALALDRMRVLKGIEEAKLRSKSEVEVQARAQELIRKHLEGSNNEETARCDLTSHYILRLAYCRTPELRKWLLMQETELFRLRFMDLMQSSDDKAQFLARSHLTYTPVERQEVERLRGDLKAVMVSQATKEDVQEEELRAGFFKVPFTAVPDLVAARKCLVRAGWAYVSSRDLCSLVVQDFRASLSKGLTLMQRRYRNMFPDNDVRLRPLVAGLSTRYLGGGAVVAAAACARHGPLTAASLPGAAAQHFPLCAQTLLAHLQSAHHLRHAGRQQLSLLLKAVGLPLEEALVFWRTSMAPVVPYDKFEKEYAYNIRHNYGKEGARKDYSAHTCVSIVRMTGGAGEPHGCPYKRMDEAHLRAALARAKCDPSKVDEVVSKAKAGHYQIACACAFEGTHDAPMDSGINHPAEYYAESRRLADERAGQGKEAATAGGTGAGPSSTPADAASAGVR